MLIRGGLGAAIFAASLFASAEHVVEVETEATRSIRFMYQPTENATASVVLFPGSHGRLRLKAAKGGAPARVRWGEKNVIVASRALFAAQGLAVALFEQSSLDSARGRRYRFSETHAREIGTVVQFLRERHPGAPVWLVGHSRGTLSAANGVLRNLPGVGGAVLAAPITRTFETHDIYETHPRGLLDAKWRANGLPLLVLTHAEDGCAVTLPGAANALAGQLRRNKINAHFSALTGGTTPLRGPCRALSKHSFIGIEQKAVALITDFVRRHSPKN